MEKEWLAATIEHIAAFSRGQRGVTRLAFSDEDRQADEYIKTLLTDSGLKVSVDAFGNIIGRLEGKDPAAGAVATGSHLDTVPEGGKYDGVAGVAGGLAALRRLKERGPLTHPVELIIFMAEESSRFGFATLGSKVMTGRINLAAWMKAADQQGTTLAAALARQGFDLARVREAERRKEEFKAFVELHIEQGPLLERAGKSIGIVETIAAPTRLRISVEGFAAHSGTTPMDTRRDALVSAAMIILEVREIALEHHHEGTVGTVGLIEAHPNAMNVIPGRVELGVDIRGVDQESIIETIQDIKDAVITIADEQETPVAIDVLAADRPVPMDQDIIALIEDTCERLGVSHKLMNSGAGHDAMNMAALAPSGMIFVPCREGISHNPDESVAAEDIMTGVDVLTETLYQLAK